MPREEIRESDCPIHAWFALSYAHWITIPRVLMEDMPRDWRERMARCLEEFDDAFDWRPDGRFYVVLKGNDGRYKSLPNYGYYRRPDYDILEKLRKK